MEEIEDYIDMKDSCSKCGIVIDLDCIKTIITEEGRTSYSSESYTHNVYHWTCPVCKNKNSYSTEK